MVFDHLFVGSQTYYRRKVGISNLIYFKLRGKTFTHQSFNILVFYNDERLKGRYFSILFKSTLS